MPGDTKDQLSLARAALSSGTRARSNVLSIESAGLANAVDVLSKPLFPRSLVAPTLLMVAVLASLRAGAWEPRAHAAVASRAEPFPLTDVRLLGGPLKVSQDIGGSFLLGLDLDRLLARYRAEAGLPTKAQAYPGWEANELPGVGLGFYLSGCSHHYAATGDRRYLERVERALAALADCQAAHSNGFLLATRNGKRIFAEIEAGDIRFHDGWKLNGECEPYYALEKLMSGLRDSYRAAGVPQALDIDRKLGDWLDRHTAKLDNAALRKIMACEFGGLNWVLADLYADTGDARYLAASQRWRDAMICDPLARGQDILPGMHANTQFPKISGLAARYPWSGDRTDRVTAEFFWDRVVHHHSYVTGGNSLGEHFGPPDQLSARLGPNTAESCNVYNMLRLSLLLEAIEPRVEYADFMERALFGHVLPAQHSDGRVCYFLPLSAGATKPYEPLHDRFSCCTCSGMDSYSLHAAYLFLRSPDTLYVNLFAPAEVRWREKGLTARLETTYPDNGEVRLRLACSSPTRLRVALRCPGWLTGGLVARVNGGVLDSGEPGHWLVLERTWSDGDRVEFLVPLTLRTEAMPDDARRIAFFAGPILLAADLGPASSPSPLEDVPALAVDEKHGESLAERVRPGPGGPLAFTLAGGEMGEVRLSPFFRIQDRRYTVYWDAVTHEELGRRQNARAAEKARLAELDARTIDRVQPGVEASETAHGLQAERSHEGSGAYGQHMNTRWRDASEGWFLYQLKVPPERPVDLLCTYWGHEVGARAFDILVDGTKVTSHTLDSNHPAAFYDVTCPLPAELTKGKTTVTVKFQAHAGNTAGGLFGLRTVEHR